MTAEKKIEFVGQILKEMIKHAAEEEKQARKEHDVNGVVAATERSVAFYVARKLLTDEDYLWASIRLWVDGDYRMKGEGK